MSSDTNQDWEKEEERKREEEKKKKKEERKKKKKEERKKKKKEDENVEMEDGSTSITKLTGPYGYAVCGMS
jgi:hypothetical protein